MENKDTNTIKEKSLNTLSLISFIFAFILVQFYFISPSYFIFKYNNKYIRKKHIPFLQIFLNLLNTSTYVFISFSDEGDFQTLITNTIGVILCLIVIIQLYFALSKKKNSKNILLHFVLIFNTIFQIYYGFFKFIPDSKKVLTIINNILMYLSLNIGTYFAFKESKSDRIPILSAVLGLLSSIGWMLYAYFQDDIDSITFISNIVSCSVNIFTIGCYIYVFIRHKPIKNEIHQKKENENDINS